MTLLHYVHVHFFSNSVLEFAIIEMALKFVTVALIY